MDADTRRLTAAVQYFINLIFQHPYPLAAITNTRGHRPHTPLPDPRSAHEHLHQVRSARDGRPVEYRKGSEGEWRRAGGGRA